MAKIVKLTTYDLRFPTSDNLDGSDAMNPLVDSSSEDDGKPRHDNAEDSDSDSGSSDSVPLAKLQERVQKKTGKLSVSFV